MVLKFTKGGTRIHGPPYTKSEEAEFCRRQGRGPVTVVRPLMTVKSRSPEHRGGRRRQNRAVPERSLESIDRALTNRLGALVAGFLMAMAVCWPCVSFRTSVR